MVRYQTPLLRIFGGTDAQISLRIPRKFKVVLREEHDRALLHERAMCAVKRAFYELRHSFCDGAIYETKKRTFFSQKCFDLVYGEYTPCRA